jgi:hypothetical protein
MLTTKLSFIAGDKNNLTIAEKWLKNIDDPWMQAKTPDQRAATGIDRRAVRQMKRAAVEEIQDASPRHGTLYLFGDNTGLYEKRKDDWFTLSAEDVKMHEADCK